MTTLQKISERIHRAMVNTGIICIALLLGISFLMAFLLLTPAVLVSCLLLATAIFLSGSIRNILAPPPTVKLIRLRLYRRSRVPFPVMKHTQLFP